ncbi:uncharacterized protein [Panulirus ornatus]|uniref:uncharacterized protein isoform X3 n=1 Tax=Panulirus ornatus TaxID=150431 RepID=UPI003A83636A
MGKFGQDVIASLCAFWPIGFVIMVGNMSYKWIFEIQLLVLACTLQMNELDYIAWKGAQACCKTENEMAWQPVYLKIPNICSHAGDNDARLVLSSTRV